MGCLVAHLCAAFVTAVDDYVAALGVGESADGAKRAAAGVCSVTGVYIHVK